MAGIPAKANYFYPRSPCGERRLQAHQGQKAQDISIHALLAESDGIPNQVGTWEVISIHALLAESDHPEAVPCSPHADISIHALLAESDSKAQVLSVTGSISIHALLAESDPPVRDIIQWEGIFLSTLSLRRATNEIPYQRQINQFLSTLSLRRATSTLR